MYKNNFIVFDLETGGLISKTTIPPITEIGICVIDSDLQDVQEYESMIIPYREESEYKQAALDVSNITLDMCRKTGKDTKVVFEEVKKILIKSKVNGKKPVLVGHNIDAFDIPILSQFFEEQNDDLSKYVEERFTIDTLWWGRMKHPDLTGYKLGDCLTQNNIDIVNAHRALVDVKANKDLFVKWMKLLRGESQRTSLVEEKPFRSNFRFQIRQK